MLIYMNNRGEREREKYPQGKREKEGYCMYYNSDNHIIILIDQYFFLKFTLHEILDCWNVYTV